MHVYSVRNDLKEIPSCDEMEEKCYSYQLDGLEVLDCFSDREKKEIWNGFGPDRFPQWLRNVLTSLHNLVLPACYIHDLDFAFGGSKSHFYNSNRRLKKNSLKILHINRKQIGFFRYVVSTCEVYIAWKLCDLFGYKGWKKF